MRLPEEEGRRRHPGKGRRLTEVWLQGSSLKLINRLVDSQFIDSHAVVSLFILLWLLCVSPVLHFLITCRAPNEE